MYLQTANQPPRGNNPETSVLVTALLTFLKEKEPELCSPALRKLETSRNRRR
jgi:hypothetical protein